jgi:hypothetical protein
MKGESVWLMKKCPWCGGEMTAVDEFGVYCMESDCSWSIDGEEAAKFVQEADAEMEE